MFQHLTIRNKMALVVWGVAIVAYGVTGLGLSVFQHVTLSRRARQIMEPYAQLVSIGAEAAVAFEDQRRAQQILDTLRANHQVISAGIVLSDGRILAGFPQPAGIVVPASVDGADLWVAGDTATMVKGLRDGARLHLAISLGDIRRQDAQVLWMFGGGLLVLFCITLGQLVVLNRTIVRPIATLAKASERVRTAGDYEQRLPAHGTDEAGRLGQSFNAIMQAVVERESDLRRLTTFQRALLDHAAYGIISVGADGIVSSFNPAAERLLGYTAAETIGKLNPTCWHDHDEIAARARQLSAELGEPVPPSFEVFAARARRSSQDEWEWTFIRKDGTRVPVLLSVTALRDERGEITGFVGLVTDFTERRRAEAEVRRLNEDLERRVAQRTSELRMAYEELESFSYSVSHDLRAPLRSLDGFSSILLEDYADRLDAEGAQYLSTIRSASHRMGQMIDDMLMLSRVTRTEMRRAPVDLSALAARIVDELRRQDPERAVAVDIEPGLVVPADPSLMEIALTNLLGNAWKFTMRRPDAHIELCRTTVDGASAFVVRDNGAGFDAAYAHKLFGAFQRLHTSSEFPGTGVGLATVQRIVRRHGGRVWAEGAPSQGASFYFTVPEGNP